MTVHKQSDSCFYCISCEQLLSYLWLSKEGRKVLTPLFVDVPNSASFDVQWSSKVMQAKFTEILYYLQEMLKQVVIGECLFLFWLDVVQTTQLYAVPNRSCRSRYYS